MKKVAVKLLTFALAVLIAGYAYASNAGTVANGKASSVDHEPPVRGPATLHKTIEVNGVKIFYREAGSKNAPTLLLLHGYPTSSHMFRNLGVMCCGQFQSKACTLKIEDLGRG